MSNAKCILHLAFCITVQIFMSGHLIVFEGLDQSGKQTQAEMLRDRLKQDGRKARLVSFPDYGTSIGEEIARPMQAERDRYERDLAMQERVRESYRRQAAAGGWVVINGERSKDQVAADVFTAVASRLAPR